MAGRAVKAGFIEPMLLRREARLPEGADWLYEVKLDGYRALAIKSGGRVTLRSRNDNDFSQRYPGIVKALAPLPNETVIDGEVVALDETDKPSFNVLQDYGSSGAPIVYYIFDILVLAGRDVMGEPLATRRALLETRILPKLRGPVGYSVELKARMLDLIASVKAQGLEGLVAKRRSSLYEPGQRSGSWQKMRVNRGQTMWPGASPPRRCRNACGFRFSFRGDWRRDSCRPEGAAAASLYTWVRFFRLVRRVK